MSEVPLYAPLASQGTRGCGAKMDGDVHGGEKGNPHVQGYFAHKITRLPLEDHNRALGVVLL